MRNLGSNRKCEGEGSLLSGFDMLSFWFDILGGILSKVKEGLDIFLSFSPSIHFQVPPVAWTANSVEEAPKM